MLFVIAEILMNDVIINLEDFHKNYIYSMRIESAVIQQSVLQQLYEQHSLVLGQIILPTQIFVRN